MRIGYEQQISSGEAFAPPARDHKLSAYLARNQALFPAMLQGANLTTTG